MIQRFYRCIYTKLKVMIEYIKGELTELTPALATIEAGGVGYGLNISLNTYSACQGKKEVKLYVYEAIREDAHVLFGFYNKKEREMFLLEVPSLHPSTMLCATRLWPPSPCWVLPLPPPRRSSSRFFKTSPPCL